MRQVLQDMAKGSTNLIKSPVPTLKSGSVLISTTTSLISSGTERMLVNFGKSSYLEKARQQPEKVKMVLEKIKTDGFFSTIDAIRSQLAQPLPLGYCNVGVVAKVGQGNLNFKPGDRVVSNGPHAEIVNVPANLCALIPDNVDDECAAFTVVASIGLQGIRLAQPTLGECFVVIGVGLIGLLTIQLLKAQSCRVLAIDFDEQKLQLAKQFGADICNLSLDEDPVNTAMIFSHSQGVDGVIITASSKTNDPITQAARMSRKRGRIVLIGTTKLELNRSDFYEKELSFQVSCSYGPGRYDTSYEENGLDYPIGFVRWTLKRNFEAVLELMANKKLDLRPLISHRFIFDDASKAYELLTEDKSALGLLLQYPSDYSERAIQEINLKENVAFDASKPILSVIGAGNYASRILLPIFKKSGAQLHTLVTANGINGVIHGEKAGFCRASTDVEAMFSNKEINTIAIVTRHNTHAELVIKGLTAGKHIFVEKPLAITLDELSRIEATYHETKLLGRNCHLMVGFNRRFSPHAQKIKLLLNSVKEPKVFIMTINAGSIPANHWTQDLQIGGGRIIGEACHFIDLMRFFSASDIISVQARKISDRSGCATTEDKAVITLGFADGSLGTIYYLANGSAKFPKERIEVFAGGRILQLDNFRRLQGFGWSGFKAMNLWRQDKGQHACCKVFLEAIKQGKEAPIPISEILEVTRVAIEAAQLLRAQQN